MNQDHPIYVECPGGTPRTLILLIQSSADSHTNPKTETLDTAMLMDKRQLFLLYALLMNLLYVINSKELALSEEWGIKSLLRAEPGLTKIAVRGVYAD